MQVLSGGFLPYSSGITSGPTDGLTKIQSENKGKRGITTTVLRIVSKFDLVGINNTYLVFVITGSWSSHRG